MAWLQLPQTPVKRAVYGALIISTIVGVLHVFACWFSVAPHGSDILYNKISGMLLIYLLLVVLYNVVRITFAVVGRLFGIGKAGWSQLAGGAIFAELFSSSLRLPSAWEKRCETRPSRPSRFGAGH